MLKKLLPILILLLICPFSGHAQTSVTGDVVEGPIAVRPATCSSGDLYFATDTFVLYQCGPSNTWTNPSGGQFAYSSANSTASITLNAAGNAFFDFALVGNVTSMSVASAGQTPGTIYGVQFCQPSSVGTDTVVWPAVFNNPPFVLTGPNQCTSALFKLNGSATWDNVSFNGVFQTTSTGQGVIKSNVTVNGDYTGQGPNLRVDCRIYGCRATNPNTIPSVPGCTATINSGSSSPTLSSGCALVTKDGLDIQGAGPTNTASTPVAPVVTPSLPQGSTGSGYVVNGPVGVTGWGYEIAAIDFGQGVTAASAAGTTSTGAATLGGLAVNVSSQTRSGNTTTVTTSTPHGLPVGCANGSCPLVYIGSGNSLTDVVEFAGWFIVTSVADTTHFTYVSGNDTRYGVNSTTSTGGTVSWWNVNHLQLPITNPAGVRGYAIYGRNCPTTCNLIGISMPVNAGITSDPTYMVWDDFGATMMGNATFPSWLPTTAPSVATNDTLVTTITAGGGTTTPTLANTASNSVAGATILIDNEPSLVACVSATASTGGTCYIPVDTASPTINKYVISSYTNLAAVNTSAAISQAGGIFLNDTVVWQNGRWWGDIDPNSVATAQSQFAYEPHVTITTGAAYPGLFITGGGAFRGLAFNTSTANLYNEIFNVSGGPMIFENDSWSGGSGNDEMGIEYYGFTSQGGGFGGNFRNFTFTTGTPNFFTATPLFLSKNNGEWNFHYGSCSNRGFTFIAGTNGGTNVLWDLGEECQSGSMPELVFMSRGVGGSISWISGSLDTDSNPFAANWASTGTPSVSYSGPGSGTSGGFASLTGRPFSSVSTGGVQNTAQTGQNFNITTGGCGFVYDGNLNIPCSSTNRINQIIGPNSSIYTDPGIPSAPTCTTITAGPPFPAAGTYSFVLNAFFPNGGLGLSSPASNSCTVNGTTQQITITYSLIPGATGYSWTFDGVNFVNVNGVNCVHTTLPPTTSWTFEGGSCGFNSAPNWPGGGLAGFSGGIGWSNVFNLGQYMDALLLTTPPANPASSKLRTYADNSTLRLTCLTSTGANCLFPWTFGALTASTNSNAGTFAATGNTWDFTGTTLFKLRVGAGLTTSANGDFAFDSTNNNWHGWNGADLIFVPLASGFVSGHCAQPTTSSGKWTLIDTGNPCGTGSSAPCGASLSVQYNNSGVCGGIPVPTAPNNVSQSLVSTPVGGVGTVAAFHLSGVATNAQTGTTYTIAASDRAGYLSFNNAGAIAVTLPQAGSGGGTNNDFTSNFVFSACDLGAGTATITPTTSTISYVSGGSNHGGAASMPISTGQCAFVYSDNTNYFAFITGATGLSTVQTNTVNNTSQTTLNLLNSAATNGITLTVTNTSAGNVQLGITGTLNNAGLTNSTVTVSGTVCTLGSSCTPPPGSITVANAGSTGTTVNTLTKLTGAPSTAVILATTDTTGTIGITTSGAGTTGSANIQLLGSVSCVFDGATIAGDYVQISSTVAGNCHDTNSANYPTSGTGDVIGRVLSTNGAAGTYTIDLFPQEIAAGTNNVTASANFTNGDLIQAAGNNKTTSDSGIVATNVVTQTSNAASGQICTYTGANKVCVPATALPNGVTATTQSTGDNTTDVATDAFVQTALTSGINPPVMVLVATTGSNLVGTYSNGSSGIGATFTITATGTFILDGVTINTIGQRVLLKDQSSAFQNGVYTATTIGTTGVSAVFTRATNYNQSGTINYTVPVFVQSGTANSTTSWQLTSTVTNVGTDSLTYVQSTISPTQLVTSANTLTSNIPAIGAGSKTLSAGYVASPGTVTSGHLACYTSSGVVGNCTSLSGVLGVFLGGTTWTSSGEATVTLETTTTVTFGDNLCVSSTSFGTVHDNGTIACTTGLGVGIVKTTAVSVTSATAFIALR